MLHGSQPFPLFEYLDNSVISYLYKSKKIIHLTLQGNLVDFSFLAGQDTHGVQCHRVMAVAVSPFLQMLLKETNSNQIILADFSMVELTCLMNLIYTGK